jgi:hypothetical protein
VGGDAGTYYDDVAVDIFEIGNDFDVNAGIIEGVLQVDAQT